MVRTARYSDLTLYRRLLGQARSCRPHLAGILLLSLLAPPLMLLTPLPLKILVDSVIGSRPVSGFRFALSSRMVSPPTPVCSRRSSRPGRSATRHAPSTLLSVTDNLAACAETENPLRVANDRGRLTRVFRLLRCFARGGHRWERRTDGAGWIVSCARCGRMRHGGFRGDTFLRAHTNLGYRIEFPVSRAVQVADVLLEGGPQRPQLPQAHRGMLGGTCNAAAPTTLNSRPQASANPSPACSGASYGGTHAPPAPRRDPRRRRLRRLTGSLDGGD